MPNPNAGQSWDTTLKNLPGQMLPEAWRAVLAQLFAQQQAGAPPQSFGAQYVPRAATSTARRAQQDALAGVGNEVTSLPQEISDEMRQNMQVFSESTLAMRDLDAQIAQAKQAGDAATAYALTFQREEYRSRAAEAARFNTDPQNGVAALFAKLEAMSSPTQRAIESRKYAPDPTEETDETGEAPSFWTPEVNDFYAAGRPDLAELFLEQLAGVKKTSAFDKMGQMLGLQGMMEDITSSRAARKRAEESAQRAAAQQAFANLMARSQLQQDAFKMAQAYGLSPDAQYVPGFEPGGLFAGMAQRGGYEFAPMAPLNLPQPAGLANPAPQWAYQAMNRGM